MTQEERDLLESQGRQEAESDYREAVTRRVRSLGFEVTGSSAAREIALDAIDKAGRSSKGSGK